jgi:HPt (histidine-containing phosphotransfer) domain-containing protein
MSIELKDSTTNAIDAIKFHRLQRLFGDDFGPALESFVTQSQIYCHAIQTAIIQDRFQDAMGIAHKLKSSSGLYGFWKVSKLSNDIERVPMTAGATLLLKLQSDLDAALQEAINTIGDQA